MNVRPAGFMSYVRSDDANDNGRISELRKRLEGEIRVQSGDNTFHIFQDREDIAWGQQWAQRINESLDAVTFLFPVITPGFFKSTACRDELKRFLDREKQLRRKDLILPIYYVDTPLLSNAAKRKADELGSLIADRQHADWRDLRFEPLDSPHVGRVLAKLAKEVVDALERPTGNAASKGELPQQTVEPKATRHHADQRLNETIDFGSSLEEIATNFKRRMDEFNAIEGAGPDKFLDLGAHVYSCCARSLDMFLANNAPAQEHRAFVQAISMRLKRLADYGPDYFKSNPFPKYWADGTEIADELITHVRHAGRFA
jgi:hypothetical protein